MVATQTRTMSIAGSNANPPQHCDENAPLRFERRAIDRWPLQSIATAYRLSGKRFGHTHELHTIDCSTDGLGAISQSVIEPGTIVSIGFQSPGSLPKRGTVLRCVPCGQGYRVAIQFEARMAA